MTTAGAPSLNGAVKQFHAWATAVNASKIRYKQANDKLGWEQAAARHEAYLEAVNTARRAADVTKLATQLMARARDYSVRPPDGIPNEELDAAALSYFQARAFQHCALWLDSTLPEVQPPWT